MGQDLKLRSGQVPEYLPRAMRQLYK